MRATARRNQNHTRSQDAGEATQEPAAGGRWFSCPAPLWSGPRFAGPPDPLQDGAVPLPSGAARGNRPRSEPRSTLEARTAPAMGTAVAVIFTARSPGAAPLHAGNRSKEPEPHPEPGRRKSQPEPRCGRWISCPAPLWSCQDNGQRSEDRSRTEARTGPATGTAAGMCPNRARSRADLHGQSPGSVPLQDSSRARPRSWALW